jgi:hypothetical protein
LGEVIDLQEVRQAREPHLSGDIECRFCGHTWTGVAPVGTTDFECPSCHNLTGLMRGPVVSPGEADSYFVCMQCQSYAFSVHYYRNNAVMMCRGCGQEIDWSDVFPETAEGS